MNNIFKVIWNHATQTWTAVGELALAKGKSKSVKLVAISTALFSTGVYAAQQAAGGLISISNSGDASTVANASGENAIAVGREAESETNNSVAIGSRAVVLKAQNGLRNANGIAIGTQARVEPKPDGTIVTTSVNDTMAIGTRALATGPNSIVIGQDASSVRNQQAAANYQSGENTVAIGKNASADWNNSIAIGLNAKTNVGDSIAIGSNAIALTKHGFANNLKLASVAIGPGASSIGSESLAVGRYTKSGAKNSSAIGNQSFANGEGSTAIGSNTYTGGQSSVALGQGASTGWTGEWHNVRDVPRGGERAIAIGENAHGATTDSYAFGANSFAGAIRSTSMGRNAVSYGNQALAIGSSEQNGFGAIAIKNNSAAFGTHARAIGVQTIALGYNASAGLTKESADALETAYNTYRTAYNTYHNLKKTQSDKKTSYEAEKTAVSTYATNLKIFAHKYGNDGSLQRLGAEFEKAFNDANAGIKYSELTKFTEKLTKEPSDSSVELAIANKELIKKIAGIGETGVGEKNEKLAHLVTLAKNLVERITKVEKAKTALDEATEAQKTGETVFKKAETAFTENEKYKYGQQDAIAIGASSEAAAKNAIALGARNIVYSGNSGAFGVDNKIYSQNAYVLGNHVEVRPGYNNAVVLGASSDGTPTVKKVNSANVNGLVYAGFEGNFGGTSKDGTVETIDNDLKGRFVSVGSATKEENGKKVYGERQIKHVAAGEISSTSTDAINGSQLYAVASGLRDAFPVVYTDADGNKVVKYGNQYYPEGTTFDANGEPSSPAVTNVIASMNNPTNKATGKAGDNVTLTNVAPGANTYDFDEEGNPLVKIGDKYYAQDNVENGVPKKPDETKTPAEKAKKDPYEKAATGLANLEGSKGSNALTVADANKMGWVVSANGNDYADNVTNARQVRFNGKNGIKVTGNTDDETGIRNINIELEKSDVVKAGEYKIGDKTYVNVDGKLYDKDSIDPKTGKEKPNAQPSDYTVDDNGNVTNTKKPTETVAVDKGDNFVNGNTVYKAIQESGWTVGKAKDALANNKFEDKDEKVNPNDEVRFADGKGITVKTATVDAINDKGEKQTTTVVKFDTDLPINYANVKNAAGDNLTQANDGKWYKAADVNENGTLKPTGDKLPEAQTPVKTGATLADGKSDATKPYKNKDVYTYTTDPKTGEVKATPKGYDAAKPENKDSIVKGKEGVQLNNVGWAENPDQAVNKDQLDQTVNKSGFFVQQNGKTTVENAANKDETNPTKSEKVTPNDVVNFVNGKGTTIRAVTKRDANGVDTTTVSVDVDTSKLDLSNAAEYKAEENTGITVNTTAPQNGGKTTITVGNKYFKTNADGEEAKVEADAPKGSVAIGSGAKAGKAHTGNYSVEPSVNVAGAPTAATRVVSLGSKGNEAQIQNVAAGVVSETSTDAVNGSQLHATNVQVNKNAQNINRVEGKVNNLSQVINNHAGELNRLDRKVNKYGKEARAGIAGANAAAALPQVYTPGKSMVAASAGTFKGQNAVAVGYSRASDNGKVILKLQGNANTSGDVGAGVGVGYQW